MAHKGDPTAGGLTPRSRCSQHGCGRGLRSACARARSGRHDRRLQRRPGHHLARHRCRLRNRRLFLLGALPPDPRRHALETAVRGSGPCCSSSPRSSERWCISLPVSRRGPAHGRARRRRQRDTGGTRPRPAAGTSRHLKAGTPPFRAGGEYRCQARRDPHLLGVGRGRRHRGLRFPGSARRARRLTPRCRRRVSQYLRLRLRRPLRPGPGCRTPAVTTNCATGTGRSSPSTSPTAGRSASTHSDDRIAGDGGPLGHPCILQRYLLGQGRPGGRAPRGRQ